MGGGAVGVGEGDGERGEEEGEEEVKEKKLSRKELKKLKKKASFFDKLHGHQSSMILVVCAGRDGEKDGAGIGRWLPVLSLPARDKDDRCSPRDHKGHQD